MVVATSSPNLKQAHPVARASLLSRYFYSLATLVVFVIVLTGFRLFYTQWHAYPGRPLAPETRHIVVAHGLSMSLWMLIAIAQPVPVASGKKRVHRTIGKLAAALAVVIIVLGVWATIATTRTAPPQRILNGLAPKAFMVVPLSAMLVFATFIPIAIWKRNRPAVHKPLMFLATLMASTAGMGRIDAFNTPFAGTWAEWHFSAFAPMFVIGAAMLVAKRAIDQELDRVFALGLGVLLILCFAVTHLSRTATWDAVASWMIL